MNVHFFEYYFQLKKIFFNIRPEYPPEQADDEDDKPNKDEVDESELDLNKIEEDI